MKIAANLSLLFTELPLIERILGGRLLEEIPHQSGI